MDTNMIPITPKPGLHPDTGKPVIAIGVDATSFSPKMIILISDSLGTRAEVVDFVRNRPQ